MTEAIKLEYLNEAVEYLSNRLNRPIDLAIISGTGLGHVADQFDIIEDIPYAEIPHMPQTSVQSHSGSLKLLFVADRHVLIFCGRFHYYEGLDMFNITFPVRLCHGLNINNIMITNAAGGLKGNMQTSEIRYISDHIYLLPDNPLKGMTLPQWGDRFPDPKGVYDIDMYTHAQTAALENGWQLRPGVYACLSGPSLETRAELTYLKRIGADLVGMSTVPEVLVACQCGMKVLGLSVITNIVDPDGFMVDVVLQDVIDASNKAILPLSQIIKGVVRNL